MWILCCLVLLLCSYCSSSFSWGSSFSLILPASKTHQDFTRDQLKSADSSNCLRTGLADRHRERHVEGLGLKNAAAFDCSKEHLTNIHMHFYKMCYPPLYSRKSLLSNLPRLKPCNLRLALEHPRAGGYHINTNYK